MPTTKPINTARQFLLDADRDYEVGDILQASEMLPGAATRVVNAEVQRRDLESNGRGKVRRFVKALGNEIEQPDLDG